jgi:hypothetical protein
VPNTVNPAVTPTWVFTPTPNTPATIRFSNNSTKPVYVGASGVTPWNGLLVPPGSRPVEMQNVTQTVYAISGLSSISAGAGTMTASAVTAASTQVTLTAAVPAGLAAGVTFVLGNTANTTGAEVLVVNSTTASSVVTFTTPCVLDHAGGSILYPATAAIGQVTATAGVV